MKAGTSCYLQVKEIIAICAMLKSMSRFAEVPHKYEIDCILSISNEIEKNKAIYYSNFQFQFAIQYCVD